jgi:glycosyltransferase involved in cell wall biosynthesis
MTTDDCTPKLTIGLPCYEDFDGVWFSVMALRMYHADQMTDVEILVVDNNPDSPAGKAVARAVEQFGDGIRYCPFSAVRGTAATKNHVFAEASGEAVLCMDSHVLFEPGAIRRLIEFYDQNAGCMDLLHGPLVYDNLKWVSTHFEDEWRGEMWGVWASDPRGDVTGYVETGEVKHSATAREEYPPFEIPAQGMGVFSCRREAWQGFNPAFRGFGGEEFYIHEKFRKAGYRVQLLPFLRWVHRFGRPQGVPYPITVDEKLRNYLIGLAELELPIEPAIEHFSKWLSEKRIDEIGAELRQEGLLPS